jgi:hypothetical protein
LLLWGDFYVLDFWDGGHSGPSGFKIASRPVVAMTSRGLVLPEEFFKLLIDLELRKAVRLQYCFSLVCMTPDRKPADLGFAVASEMAERAVRRLRAMDAVTIFSRHSLGVLLIDAEPAALPRIIHRITEDLEADSASPGLDWRSTWSVGGSCYPQTARNRSELLGEAINLMIRAEKDGGDRFYMPGRVSPTVA